MFLIGVVADVEYLTLNNSHLVVSRLCMGCCPMGGYGWGEVNENDLVAAVHTALRRGINFFDTADTYGLGSSEKILGKALGVNRLCATISTKFGVRVENGKSTYDNSPAWIEYALKNSLKRLGTDYIDIYQIHYRDHKTPLGVVVDKLDQLKRAGYIRYFGLSNIYRENFEELRPFIGRFVSFQDNYSLAHRENEEDILFIADAVKLTPLTWGSLGQGVLTGKYNHDTVFGSSDRRSRAVYFNFHGQRLSKNLQIVDVMKDISAKYGKPLAAIAIRFILDYIPDSVALVGAKNSKQIRANAEAFGWKLSQEDVLKLDEVSRSDE